MYRKRDLFDAVVISLECYKQACSLAGKRRIASFMKHLMVVKTKYSLAGHFVSNRIVFVM